ncbi:hypothetical protein, partial [Marinomonas spartinae]|uniref:hypothetical protein n=1 Tax=Marinomonas spartinae TaxID=1792290 RepID=UPI001C3001D8
FTPSAQPFEGRWFLSYAINSGSRNQSTVRSLVLYFTRKGLPQSFQKHIVKIILSRSSGSRAQLFTHSAQPLKIVGSFLML